MGRAPCCDKANVKKGAWSPEEDAKLKTYIEAHGIGGYWLSLPHKIGLKRCGKSCRLRWLNYLRPNIKHGGFCEEEDQVICSLYRSIGSRWSMIAAQLLGRTDNDIKNHWNTRPKKKQLGMQTEPSQSPCLPSQTLSASALQRMQLLYAFFLSNIPALGGKLLETSHQTLPQMEQEIQISMSQIVQEDMDCSAAGFHGISSSSAVPNDGNESMMSWWSSNGFDEKGALNYSASSPQLDSMLQEYVLAGTDSIQILSFR